jgi:hypothetical protein
VLFSDWEHRHRLELPKAGQTIVGMSKRATMEGLPLTFAGTVTLVWWAMDEPCIEIAVPGGAKYRLLPELGDQFRIVDERMFES